MSERESPPERERERESLVGGVFTLHFDILKEDRNKPVYFLVSDISHNCSPQRQGSDLKSISRVKCDTSFMFKEEFRPQMTFHVDIRAKMLSFKPKTDGKQEKI